MFFAFEERGNTYEPVSHIQTNRNIIFTYIREKHQDLIPDSVLCYHKSPCRYIVASSRQDERFLGALKELSGDNLRESPNAAADGADAEGGEERPELFIQTGREFAPDSCKQRLQSLKLLGAPRTSDTREQLLYITSLIPFTNEIMVRAAGALLKFLDKSAIEILQLDLVDGQVPVLSVNICTM
jgi:hypothetical protein